MGWLWWWIVFTVLFISIASLQPVLRNKDTKQPFVAILDNKKNGKKPGQPDQLIITKVDIEQDAKESGITSLPVVELTKPDYPRESQIKSALEIENDKAPFTPEYESDLAPVVPVEEDIKQIVIEPVKIKQTDYESIAGDVSEDSDPNLNHEGDHGGIDVESLIDLGFEAKNNGHWLEAAEFFSRALALRPSPDLALYLLMDIYWLTSVVGRKEYGKEQLRIFGREYYHKFSLELRQQFLNWLEKENLHDEGILK